MDYMIKPFFCVDFAFGKQYLNETKSANHMSGIVEYGLIVSIKKVNIVLNGVFTPFNFKEHGYQFSAFSAGILL